MVGEYDEAIVGCLDLNDRGIRLVSGLPDEDELVPAPVLSQYVRVFTGEVVFETRSNALLLYAVDVQGARRAAHDGALAECFKTLAEKERLLEADDRREDDCNVAVESFACEEIVDFSH
jgi:hypothetical protein